MNGQSGRIALCREVIAAIQPSAIVETGTYRGTTTDFFLEFGVPIHTVEANPQFHAFSRMRFRGKTERVHLVLGDSRSFLRDLARDSSIQKDSVFFYLDAHWTKDLPLAEEITLILATWNRAVIMIDDFEVPGDSYGYDDYGPGAALTAEYLDALGRTDLFRFYPVMRAYQETGAKRGVILICNSAATAERLSALITLRRV